MADLTNADFMSPYDVAKYLSGVIPGNQDVRQNWLQSFFGNRSTTEDPTINLDREFDKTNVGGMYVHPRAKAEQITLPDFGTTELRFAYAKEALESDDFITLNQRQLGDQFGVINIQANDARRLREKAGLALGAFENLKEIAARDILFYGSHIARSKKFPAVTWNFGRTVVTTDAGYLSDYIPEIDLTTLTGNGGTGKRAWDSTGGTKAPTPYKDVVKIVKTANRRQGISAILMSDNVYEMLEADINTNYKDAADLTISVEQRIELRKLPDYTMYQGLMLRRILPIGNNTGMTVPIYTYIAYQKDRETGVNANIIPKNYVVAIPPARNQAVRYGRIMHRKANWNAMPIWINSKINGETGEIEQELHTSYVMFPFDINSVISWKVASES